MSDYIKRFALIVKAQTHVLVEASLPSCQVSLQVTCQGELNLHAKRLQTPL